MKEQTPDFHFLKQWTRWSRWFGSTLCWRQVESWNTHTHTHTRTQSDWRHWRAGWYSKKVRDQDPGEDRNTKRMFQHWGHFHHKVNIFTWKRRWRTWKDIQSFCQFHEVSGRKTGIQGLLRVLVYLSCFGLRQLSPYILGVGVDGKQNSPSETEAFLRITSILEIGPRMLVQTKVNHLSRKIRS